MKNKISHQQSAISGQQSETIHYSLFTNKRGFTLIELVITMVLMGIVALVVANALSTVIKGSLETDNRKEALDQARIAMERMTREIRNLRNNTSVTESSASQFCFTDTESSTLIDYNYSNPNIIRDTGNCAAGGGATLATNIAATFSFAYIRANGDAESPVQFSSVTTKRIRIIIPCTIQGDIQGETVTLQSDVYPIYYNLIR